MLIAVISLRINFYFMLLNEQQVIGGAQHFNKISKIINICYQFFRQLYYLNTWR